MSGDEEEERYSACETVSFRESGRVLCGIPGLRRPYVRSIIAEWLKFGEILGEILGEKSREG